MSCGVDLAAKALHLYCVHQEELSPGQRWDVMRYLQIWARDPEAATAGQVLHIFTTVCRCEALEDASAADRRRTTSQQLRSCDGRD